MDSNNNVGQNGRFLLHEDAKGVRAQVLPSETETMLRKRLDLAEIQWRLRGILKVA